MSAIHSYEFWLNTDLLTFNWAANGVAKLNDPGILSELWLNELRYEDTVITTSFDIAETLHVFHGPFVNLCIPESNAHVGSLGLSIGKNDGLVEVGPHVFWLNVGKENI